MSMKLRVSSRSIPFINATACVIQRIWRRPVSQGVQAESWFAPVARDPFDGPKLRLARRLGRAQRDEIIEPGKAMEGGGKIRRWRSDIPQRVAVELHQLTGVKQRAGQHMLCPDRFAQRLSAAVARQSQ